MIWLALAAHVASCAAIAIALGRRGRSGASGRLVFAMALFLPILGALGWLVAALARPTASDRPAPELVRTPIPGAAAAAVHPGWRRPHAGPASARVAAARRRDDPGAIALLRRALGDPDEDVRLVAHAVLEAKHRAAYRRLHARACELEIAPAAHRAALHRQLAAEHWELVRIELAEGECRVHALACARDHAQAALAGDPRGASLALLVARIELRCGNPAAAEAALARAVELGLAPAIAAPYCAEAAFLLRRFDGVRRRLAGPPDGNAAIDRLRRFWS